MSLTKTDLAAIKNIIDGSVDKKVPSIVHEIIDKTVPGIVHREVRQTVQPMFDELAVRIDQLALSTAAGFNQMDERFEEVYQRFDRVDVRLDALEASTTRLKDNFLGLQRKIS